MENYFNRHPDQIFRLGAHDHSLLQCSLNWSFCTIFDFTLLSDFRVGKEPPRDLIWKWEKSMNGVNEILVVILILRMIWRYWWEGFELDTSECMQRTFEKSGNLNQLWVGVASGRRVSFNWPENFVCCMLTGWFRISAIWFLVLCSPLL